MPYRGAYDFYDEADIALLHRVRRYAEILHRGPWTADEVARQRGLDVDRVALAPTTLGMLGAARGIPLGIVLNDRLDARDADTIQYHELGHSWLLLESGVAFCRPSIGRNPHEDSANANGALMAVPFAAIGTEDLACEDAPRIARALGVSTPYVHIRNALAVLLGEKPGDEGAARAGLNLALLAHEGWGRRVSAKIAAG